MVIKLARLRFMVDTEKQAGEWLSEKGKVAIK